MLLLYGYNRLILLRMQYYGHIDTADYRKWWGMILQVEPTPVCKQAVFACLL